MTNIFRPFSKLFISALFIYVLTATAFAQTSVAELKGIVTDENNSIIPEAQIILRSANGIETTDQTGLDGTFSFPGLPFGKYILRVQKDGFTRFEKEILLTAPTQSSAVTMTPGQVTEAVTIVLDNAEAAVESTLKLPVSIHETPRSLTVVSAARMQEQNFRQVSDILSYVPGTTQNSYRAGGYHFYSRGYRMAADDTRLDGFAGINVDSGGFGASMFGIEEAVVLRGPAGLVYGSSGAPGGFINLVSKKPQENYFSKIDLRGGGYGGNGVSFGERPMYGIDFDSTGKIAGNDRLLYRTLFTAENMNYFSRNTLDRNRYANTSLAIKLDRDGRYVLTPSVQWTRYNRPFGGGIVISPTSSLRADDGLRTINANDLSPLDVNLSAGRRIEKTSWAALDFRGVVTEKFRINAAYRYVSFDTDINSFTPQVASNAQISMLQNQNIVSRIQSKSRTDRNYHNFSADAVYEWKTSGWWRNTTQTGFYQRVLDSRATTAAGPIPGAQSPVNIYTGVISSPLINSYPSLILGPWGRDIVRNGFVQNRTSLDDGRWNVTLGFNYGENKPVVGAVRKSGIMPNASVVLNATDELAIYASYATSFNPTDPDLEDERGNRGTFQPTVGKSYEFGVKYDLLSRRINLAAAVFQNQIENALVQSEVNVLNPRGNRFYVPAGTRSSRGAEITGEFQVRQDLRISAGASYLDAVYKGFPSGLTISGLPPAASPIPNSRAEKSPRWSYNIYSRFDRREGSLKGFGAGFGMIYQGKRIGSNGAQTFAAPDPLVLPSFVRVDTGIFYRLNKHVNFAVNVENLTDELIFVNASVGSSIEIAAPRTMTFRTTFNF